MLVGSKVHKERRVLVDWYADDESLNNVEP
jgi:hypothetical protein